MRTISIPYKEATRYAYVDDQDYERVMAHRWHLRRHGRTWYAARYLTRPDGRQSHQAMHRFVLGVTDPDEVVDHINFNGLDNRRDNLRVVDRQQSACHRRKPCQNTTGFKGVSLHHGKYVRAQICANGENLHLGYFNTLEEAAAAYDEAARELHGEYAQLNFPHRPARAQRRPDHRSRRRAQRPA